MQQFEWYTNGKDNIKIFDESESIPQNYYKGFSLKNSTIASHNYYKRLSEEDKIIEKNQIKNERKLKDLETKISISLGLKTIDKKIRTLIRNHSTEEVYNTLKFNDYNDEFILNSALRTLIHERALLFQLESMPQYFSTTVDSLRSLYQNNPLLQKRSSIQDFFLSSIRQDFEAVNVLYGSALAFHLF